MLTKKCGKCGILKPASEFGNHKRDGLRPWCKPCCREYATEYRKTEYYKEDYKRWQREYLKRPEVRERIREYKKEYIQRPDVKVKRTAHLSLLYAIRAGKVSREPCAECGKEQAEGHHGDYSKPLEVLWLCFPCHRNLHAQLNLIAP